MDKSRVSIMENMKSMSLTFSIIIPHYVIPDLLMRCLKTLPVSEDIQYSSVQCCNSRLFFSILTGFSDKEKKGKKHQKSIVKQICPTLSQYRYQGDLTLKKRIKKVLHDLKMRYL